MNTDEHGVEEDKWRSGGVEEWRSDAHWYSMVLAALRLRERGY